MNQLTMTSLLIFLFSSALLMIARLVAVNQNPRRVNRPYMMIRHMLPRVTAERILSADIALRSRRIAIIAM
jgi:hypothetical protein